MKIAQDIKPISYVKSHSADVLVQLNESHRPLFVTQNGEAKAVMLDPHTFQSMQDTIKLLKIITHSEQEIREGKVRKQADVFKEFDERFKGV